MRLQRPTISVLTSLYDCKNYLDGYFQHVSCISNLKDTEIILLHNEPSVTELAMVNNARKFLGNSMRHIIIEDRESLYRSWNRGIELSEGHYIAIWNVDDIRTTNSLELQAQTLDEFPDVAMTYGDQIEINDYHCRGGKYIKHPEYERNKREFLRSFLGGSFLMWRKCIHQDVGYFDEQFKSGGDFDFWIRVVRNHPLKKTHGLLGYFLNENVGLSTSGWLQPVERTVIELRYAMFDKVNYLYLYQAIRNYRIFQICARHSTQKTGRVFPNYRSYYMKQLPLLIISIIKYPFAFIIWNLMKISVQTFTEGPAKTAMKIEKFLKAIQ